ncbi:unnamed protein product [Prunus brigantina]
MAISKTKNTNASNTLRSIWNSKSSANLCTSSSISSFFSSSIQNIGKSSIISMEKPEGYPQVDDVSTCIEAPSTSFLGTKNDMSLLESGLLRRNFSDVGENYYRFQSKVGKSVDPRLLSLVEFFRELYFRRLELFKQIFPGGQDDKFLEVPKKLGLILAKVKPDQTRAVRTMQRNLSIGSPRDFKGRESEMRLERFKIRTIDVDDGGVKGGQGNEIKSNGSK